MDAYGYAESQRPPWAGIEPKEASDRDNMPPAPGSIAPIEEESRKSDARTVIRSPARRSADANAPSDANAGVEESMFNVEDEMMNAEQLRENRVARGEGQVYRGSVQQPPTIE
jgi:hypothetical protein